VPAELLTRGIASPDTKLVILSVGRRRLRIFHKFVHSCRQTGLANVVEQLYQIHGLQRARPYWSPSKLASPDGKVMSSPSKHVPAVSSQGCGAQRHQEAIADDGDAAGSSLSNAERTGDVPMLPAKDAYAVSPVIPVNTTAVVLQRGRASFLAHRKRSRMAALLDRPSTRSVVHKSSASDGIVDAAASSLSIAPI